MYKWDGKQIARRHGIKTSIDKAILLLIIEKAKNQNSVEDALKQLKKTKHIDPSVPNVTYKRHLLKLDEYKELKQSFLSNREQKHNLVKELREQGHSYNSIVKQTGIGYNTVYGIINKYDYVKKPKKLIDTETAIKKAKKVVHHWNNYSFKGQVMTLETKEAFKLLGLEIPKL